MFQITLEAARVNAHLKQFEAAEALGVSRFTIMNWESGKTSMDAVSFKRLCNLYNCPEDVIRLPTNTT